LIPDYVAGTWRKFGLNKKKKDSKSVRKLAEKVCFFVKIFKKAAGLMQTRSFFWPKMGVGGFM